MKWYAPIYGYRKKGAMVSSDRDFRDVEDWHLDRGVPIENWSEDAWMKPRTKKDDGRPEDVLGCASVLTFSPRLRTLLEAVSIGGIQYLPVRVLHFDGSLAANYWIANVIEVREALDLTRTDYDRYPDDYFLPARRGQISSVRMPFLRNEALDGCDIFRTKEYRVYLFVSERFVEVFRKNRLTGFEFREIRVTGG